MPNHATLYERPQPVCPACQSEDIANEQPPADGLLHVNCHACGHYWAEPEAPELQQQLQDALGLPDTAFHYWASDLYVLDLPGVTDWLKANYRFWSNVKPFLGNVCTPWAGKRCLDIPFAGIQPK